MVINRPIVTEYGVTSAGLLFGLSRGWYFSPGFNSRCAFSGSFTFLLSFILFPVFFDIFLQFDRVLALLLLYGKELAQLLGALTLKELLLLCRGFQGVPLVQLCPALLALRNACVAGGLPELALLLVAQPWKV